MKISIEFENERNLISNKELCMGILSALTLIFVVLKTNKLY